MVTMLYSIDSLAMNLRTREELTEEGWFPVPEELIEVEEDFTTEEA